MVVCGGEGMFFPIARLYVVRWDEYGDGGGVE